MAVNIDRNLATLYNTESSLYIQSQFRNTGNYPNANFYQVQLDQPIGSIKELHLTHFAGVTGLTGPVFLQITEIAPILTSAPQYPSGPITFIIVPCNVNPSYYVSERRENDLAVFPKSNAPSLSRFTLRWLDLNGNLSANMPNHTLRFFVRSWS